MTSGGKREGAGRKKKEDKKITACFRVDPVAYEKAQELYGKTLSQKVDAFIKRLSKKPPKPVNDKRKHGKET